jgi:hypothetical protein
MELKDSGTLSYAAMPIALDVDILQNGAMNILRELANLKLININYKNKSNLKDSEKDMQCIEPENFTLKERMSALENLIGIIHSENPNIAERLAKEERLARQ